MDLTQLFDTESSVQQSPYMARYSKWSSGGPGGVRARASGRMKAAGKKARSELRKDALALAALATVGDAPSTYRTGGLSLRSVGGRELNFNDESVTNFAAASLTLLNGLVPGSGANERVGRKITIKSIQVQGYIGVATNDDITRLSLVVDTQANASNPAITDIYTSSNPAALREISNMPRFKVLWDSGPIGQVVTSDSEICTFDAYKRVNIGTQYNAGVAGSIADIQTNSVFLVVRNLGTGTTTGRLDVRIRYDD